MMNYSLAQEEGGKVLEVVTETLDKRFKEVVTGDANYAVGDLTKTTIMKFIGKAEGDYEFEDLTRTLSKKLKDKDRSGAGVVMDADVQYPSYCLLSTCTATWQHSVLH
jgi:hypothetical protein